MANSDRLQKAVALYYDGQSTPKVTAKGTGDVAEKIISIARENNVPLCDNRALVELLVQLELDEEVPEVLYLAVAYIIAFVYQLEGKTPEGWVKPE